MNKRYFLLVFFILFSLPVSAQKSEIITVAVSANIQFAMEELKNTFLQESGVSIRTVIGSSGQLFAQIQNGAPYDVFLSADMDYPQKLHAKGLVINGPGIYAYGTLVLWTVSQEVGGRLKSINGLMDPRVKKIAIAALEGAPYGRQAIHVLQYYGLLSQLKEKIVYGQSLSQVNQFVLSGSAQVGFTSKSVVAALPLNNQGYWMEIDRQAYEPMAQGIVVIKNSSMENLNAARLFYQFMFSSQAREILKKYGYQLPSKEGISE